MIPLNLNNASYKSGTKLTNVMNNAMLDKYDPVTGDYKGSVDLKKLGKYNYFKFVIYDIDAKGGMIHRLSIISDCKDKNNRRK